MEEKLRPPQLDPPLWTGEEPGDASLLERLESLVGRLKRSSDALRLGRDELTPADLEQAMNHGVCGRLRQAGEIEPRGYHHVFYGHGSCWSLDRGWLVFLARVGSVDAQRADQRLRLFGAQAAAFASAELTESATDHRPFEWAADDPETYGLASAVVFADGYAFDTRVGVIRPMLRLSPTDPEGSEQMAAHWPPSGALDPSISPDAFVDWLERQVDGFG